jgi:hypothetical protein
MPPISIAMPSDLHRIVRQAYRDAMAQQKTQREAFHLAMDLVLEREPQAGHANARRVVAIMLANEPELSARDTANRPGEPMGRPPASARPRQ